ncbi:MAG TPA: YoaK family protein [Kofleriaceae bacterium]|jgi:uncharacterized membrane protein YoaK (UPF0700 family)
MFQHEGDQRTHRHNQALAGYLATVAGMVNSAGFVLIGSFTSHVTGNVGRVADNLALDRSAAPFALMLVVAFFAGTFVTSIAIESRYVRARGRVYAALLVTEAGLLAAFALLSYLMNTRSARFHDVQAILLCIAMGMQNSFVTRLSGAVVRTTHLTGVMTDLGIESARWFRLWRAQLSERMNVRLVASTAPVLRPELPRTMLLLTIVGTFFLGSMLGAVLAVKWGALSLLLPTLALVAGGVYAATSGRELKLAREVA